MWFPKDHHFPCDEVGFQFLLDLVMLYFTFFIKYSKTYFVGHQTDKVTSVP